MKKIILTMAAIIGVAGYTYGQGQVVFTATVAAATQASTNNGTIGKIAGAAGAWEFALFVTGNTNKSDVGGVANTLNSPFVTPWTDPGWTFTGVYATNTGTAGRFGVSDPGQTYVTVPGTVSGSYYNFIMVGWNTAAGGGTLASLINAYNGGASGVLLYGASGICNGVLAGNNASPGNTSLIGLISGLQTPGWQLSPVPEPATFALAGLGAAAMLIFRRRK